MSFDVRKTSSGPVPGATAEQVAAALLGGGGLMRPEPASLALVPAALAGLLPRLRAALFPGYFAGTEGEGAHGLATIIRDLTPLLALALQLRDVPGDAAVADGVAERFLQALPEVQRLLATDVDAALAGDPAAPHVAEVILAYPSIKALTCQRLAHRLYLEQVPVVPRLMCELGRAATGIDIHPGARIGSHFFIDHGSGVVIGETAVVGNNVRIYQGVTLGAKSFPRDKDGRIIKGLDRHPIIGDGVVIYSGATILGRITVGEGSIIGGNVWLTNDVPPRSRLLQVAAREEAFRGHGDGI